MSARHGTSQLRFYMRKRLRRLWASWAVLSALADWRSRRTLLWSKLVSGGTSTDPTLIRLRLKALNGGYLLVRPRSTDISTIASDYVEGNHLPPLPLRDQDLQQICELGSGTGTGLAGLAVRYPRAKILGVEPDPANASLARRNLAAFGERCRLVEAAIWDEESILNIGGETPSSLVVSAVTQPSSLPEVRVSARTIDALLADEMPEGPIDYLCLALEGAEPRVLAHGGSWPVRVRSIRVELHPKKGFFGDDCRQLLEKLGFTAWIEPTWPVSFGFGLREP